MRENIFLLRKKRVRYFLEKRRREKKHKMSQSNGDEQGRKLPLNSKNDNEVSSIQKYIGIMNERRWKKLLLFNFWLSYSDCMQLNRNSVHQIQISWKCSEIFFVLSCDEIRLKNKVEYFFWFGFVLWGINGISNCRLTVLFMHA